MDNSFMEFQDVQPEYERNNRSNGLKALRCFPRCRETGHCKSGFCGTSLKCCLEVNIDQNSPPCQLDDKFWHSVTYIAELRESLIPGLSTVRFVSRQHVDSQIRSRPEKFKSLIEGKTIEVRSVQPTRHSVTKTIDLEFNSHCQAWHYDKTLRGCTRSRRKYVAASFTSPEFEIVSTKTVQKKIVHADEVLSQAIRLSRKDSCSGSHGSSVSTRVVDEPPPETQARRGGGGGRGGGRGGGGGQQAMLSTAQQQPQHLPPQRKRKRTKLRREEEREEAVEHAEDNENEEEKGEREIALLQSALLSSSSSPDSLEEGSSGNGGGGGGGSGVMARRRSAQHLPELFAALRKEDIMEL